MNVSALPTPSVVPEVVAGIRSLAARVRPRRIAPTVPPFTLTDERGREISVRPYRDDDFEALVGMYDDFDPTQRAQGVPPLDGAAIRDWLDDILDGPDAVACHGDRVVGHVSFVPDGTGRHELSIFVHQDYQRAGVGSHLLAGGLGHAREAGVDDVWLSVEKWKRYQQRFYSRAGFGAVNPLGVTCRMSRTL
jgi:ribosomal protein S18 acetylase RimI-like enzyme